MREGFRARFSPKLVLAFVFCTASIPAFAADVSAWDNDIRSAVRLIGATPIRESGGAVMRAGVEIKMQPGWKTYWRYPGDSGVPPAFDFAALRTSSLQRCCGRLLCGSPTAAAIPSVTRAG
jgi:DsbC/DsbD-like thiol-disulfide interchange protein